MTDKKIEQVEADANCFICGELNPIGLRAGFTTDAESCTSHATLQLTADYQGWQGVIHGGIIAALLDEACIYACRGKAEQCVTAELQVRYRKPVPANAEVTVTGKLLDSSRKIWQAEAQVKIDDTLYAEATAKIFILNS